MRTDGVREISYLARRDVHDVLFCFSRCTSIEEDADADEDEEEEDEEGVENDGAEESLVEDVVGVPSAAVAVELISSLLYFSSRRARRDDTRDGKARVDDQ